MTDDFVQEQIRYTDDVDLIVHVVGRPGWHQLQSRLRAHGFKDYLGDDAIVFRMQLGELKVDFMPDDPQILGFSNRWYGDALATAAAYELRPGLSIRLVQPAYFVATKLEAYQGRGKNDLLGSQDVEDLLNLFDGRTTLLDELAMAQSELRLEVAHQLGKLLANPRFDYAVQSACQGDADRETLLFERLEAAVALGASA